MSKRGKDAVSRIYRRRTILKMYNSLKIFETLIIELFRMIVADMYLSFLLEAKKSRKLIYAIILVLSITITITQYVFGAYYICLLLRILAFFFIACNHSTYFSKRIITSFFVFVISIGSDSLVYSIFLGGKALYSHENMVCIISVLFMLLFGILLRQTVNKGGNRAEIDRWIEFLIIPGISAVSLPLLMTNKNISHEAIIYISIFIVMLNLIVYYLYESLLACCSEALENSKLNSQLVSYENQLKLEEESELKVRILRHDLKNHILKLKQLNGESKHTELSEYLNSMEESLYVKEYYVETGNYAIDGIMNLMIAKAKEKGISVVTSIKIPNDLTLSQFDMSCLLGNLMDNAIEGTCGIESPRIDFLMKYDRGCLLINISNPYVDHKKSNKGRYFTTKKDKSAHGLGLYSIEQITRKYDGCFCMSDKNYIFTAEVELFP